MKTLTVRNRKFQRGFSKFGFLMAAVLLTAFFTMGLKVGPLYIDHNLIVGICEELIENGEANNMTTSDIRNRVSNSLRINNITGFELSNITMRKENSSAIISINYERRVELIGNLDMVAKFDNELR